MLRRTTHMTILPVITHVVNVRNQASQASVTRSCPFCECTCHFEYRPQNVGSTNAYQLESFQDNLKANFFYNSPTVSNSSFCIDGRRVMVWRPRPIARVFCLLIRDTVQRISLHVHPCRRDHAKRFEPCFSDCGNFSVDLQRFAIRTFYVFVNHLPLLHPQYTWSRF